MILIFILYALFASAFTLGKDVLNVVPPLFFIGIRMTLAGFLLSIFMLIFKRKEIRIKKSEIGWFIALIAFHIYGSYVAEYIAMQYISSSKACLLYNTSPFLTALLSYIFFKERLTSIKFLGLSIGFLAFIPTLLHQSESTMVCFFSWPDFLLLFSVLCAAIGWIFMKKLTHEFHHSYFFVNTIAMLIGGILVLCTSVFFESWPLLSDVILNDIFLRSLFGLILVSNVIGYNLYGYLLHRYSPTLLSFFGCITPFFAAFFGWLFLQEKIELSFWITLFLASFGLYLYYREELN